MKITTFHSLPWEKKYEVQVQVMVSLLAVGNKASFCGKVLQGHIDT